MSESSSLLPPEPWPQRMSRILAWVGGAIILVGCSGLITIDIITRYLFKRGMVESFEVSGYALAACIGLGLGFATTSKTHIRVDILLDAFPRPIRVAFDLLAALSMALLAVALAWFCWGTLAQSMAMNAKSVSALQTPMALPQSIWWVGIFWFACVAVLLPIQAALRLLAGDGPGFDALIGSLRVAEEISQAGVEQAPPAKGAPR